MVANLTDFGALPVAAAGSSLIEGRVSSMSAARVAVPNYRRAARKASAMATTVDCLGSLLGGLDRHFQGANKYLLSLRETDYVSLVILRVRTQQPAADGNYYPPSRRLCIVFHRGYASDHTPDIFRYPKVEHQVHTSSLSRNRCSIWSLSSGGSGKTRPPCSQMRATYTVCEYTGWASCRPSAWELACIQDSYSPSHM
eukprot:57979-Amorphochlora_amoeboformis.AAC.1